MHLFMYESRHYVIVDLLYIIKFRYQLNRMVQALISLPPQSLLHSLLESYRQSW